MMRTWLMVGVLALGSIATMTAATIVNVALPSVIGALGLGQDEAQWLSTAFLASSTGFMLFNTWAVARWGMRACFVLAMALFMTGSVIGSAAQDLSALILGRVLQGAGAGLIQPMAMLIIYTRFPEGARGLAIGLYSLCVILSPAFGPVLGGVLIDVYDWRVVFAATAPLAVLAAPLGWRLLPRREQAHHTQLDWVGLTLVMAALALLLQGLAHGSREGWDDPGTAARLWAGVGVTTAFIAWEARQTHPVLNLRLFTRPGFCAAGLAIILTGAIVYGSTWLAPLFVQQVQYYSPAGAGEILAPAGLAMALCFPLAGRLTDRIDTRLLLIIGAIMFGASMLILSDVGLQTEFSAIALALALGRAGIGVIMPAANASAMRHGAGLLAAAAPAATFLSQTGGAFGVAAISALLQLRTAFHSDVLAPLVNLDAGQTQITLEEAARAVSSAALLLGFRDCFLVIGVTGLMLVPVALMAGDRSNFTDRLKRALTLFR